MHIDELIAQNCKCVVLLEIIVGIRFAKSSVNTSRGVIRVIMPRDAEYAPRRARCNSPVQPDVDSDRKTLVELFA